MLFNPEGKRIFVAGHKGMVGAAVMRRLGDENCTLITADRRQADLCRQQDVEAFMSEANPDAVIICAAKVGGILANDTRPAEFLYENLMIEANLIDAAHRAGVDRVLFLGSTCIYPKFAEQPIAETSLLTGPLEPTNEWYAIAKIAGVKLCDAYRRQYGRSYVSAMPTNLYGPHDNFDLETSHVLPALMRKIHEAKQEGRNEVVIWGDGSPLREFMHVDDLADALIHVFKHYDEEGPINAGTGVEISIKELAMLIASTVGYDGGFVFDTDKPNGTPRKMSDVSKLSALGWQSSISLQDGVKNAYQWFLENHA